MSEQLIAEATKNGIWTLLAVALLLYTIKSSEKREEQLLKNKNEMRAEFKEMQDESRTREITLMNHLDKTNESHEKIAESMEKIENRMDEGFNKIWATIEQQKGS